MTVLPIYPGQDATLVVKYDANYNTSFNLMTNPLVSHVRTHPSSLKLLFQATTADNTITRTLNTDGSVTLVIAIPDTATILFPVKSTVCFDVAQIVNGKNIMYPGYWTWATSEVITR